MPPMLARHFQGFKSLVPVIQSFMAGSRGRATFRAFEIEIATGRRLGTAQSFRSCGLM
jgi:hypothetical protein